MPFALLGIAFHADFVVHRPSGRDYRLLLSLGSLHGIFGTLKSGPQGGSSQVRSFSIPPGPVSEVHGVLPRLGDNQ